MGNERVGDLLVAKGLVDRRTAEALATERVVANTKYLSVAVRGRKVPEAEALKVLAARFGVPAADISAAVIPTEALRKVPQEVANRHLLLPLKIAGPNLILAMADPSDWRVIDEVEFATGMSILPHGALHFRLGDVIPAAYGTGGSYYIGPNASSRPGVEEGDVPTYYEGAEPPARGMGAGEDEPLELGDDDLEVDDDSEVLAGDAAVVGTEPKLIVVVEDESDIQQLVIEALKPLGHTVMAAGRGLEALKLIKAKKPDLIILDAMLPEVHGFEICRKVKDSKRFGGTPVLMISAIYRGWRIAEDIKQQYKANEFLEKPFRVGDLRRLAKRLLEREREAVNDDELSAQAQARLADANKAFKGGELDEAFEMLREVEELEPFSGRVQYWLGQVLAKRDRAFQAIYHYERAIQLQPNFFAASRSLAQLYQQRGFANKAREMWERCMQTAPDPETRDQIKNYLVNMP